MVYNFKVVCQLFQLESGTSFDYKVEQIEELPKEVGDARNHLYYVRTKQNLFCLGMADHQVKASYYKDVRGFLPQVLQFGFLIVKGQFSLTLMI